MISDAFGFTLLVLSMSLFHANRLVRLLVPLLGVTVAVAQLGCGDPTSGPLHQEPTLQVADMAVASENGLRMSVRDTNLLVGQVTEAQVTDAQFVAAARRRFLASPVTWTSSDSLIATVNAEGAVTARAVGSTTITAEWQGKIGTRVLVVSAVEVPPPTEAEPPAQEPAPPAAPPQAGIPQLPAGSPAALPRSYVEVPDQDGSGTTIRVREGASVQAAIDAARPGDIILLEAGAVYSESLLLRKKSGSGWITIRTEGMPTAAGVRVALSDTLRFARIQSLTSSPAIRTESGASGYRLINLHLTVGRSRTSHNSIVAFGDGGSAQDSYVEVPSHLVIDRSIVRGRPDLTLRRCISLQSAHSAVANSLVLECHEKGADSQAIAGWNGPGPFLIENNHLEGAGETVMFGGAHPSILGLHPADIVIRYNRIRKPAEWHASQRWTVKSHVQFKHAQRVLMYHNVLEGNWPNAQTGSSVAVSSSNQGGGPTTWAETRDLTFFENVIRQSGRGFSVAGLGSGPAANAVRASRMLFAGNVLYQLGSKSPFGGRGDPLTLMNGVANVMIVENTFDGMYNALSLPSDANPPQMASLTYERNVSAFGTYGVFGGGTGLDVLRLRYSPLTFSSNCYYGITNWNSAPQRSYPAPNVTTAQTSETVMPGIGVGDVTLSSSSACAGISVASGKRLGARPDLVSMIDAWVVPGLSRR